MKVDKKFQGIMFQSNKAVVLKSYDFDQKNYMFQKLVNSFKMMK